MPDVGALRISLGLDSVDFTKGMKNVNNRLNALNAEFKAIRTGSDKFDSSLDQLKASSDVLNRTLDTQKVKIQELKRRYEESVRVKGEDADETIRLAAQYNRAVSAMNKTENQLKRIESQIDSQTNKWKKLSSSLGDASAKMNKYGDKLKETGESLSLRLSAPIAGAGLAVGKLANDFDSAAGIIQAEVGSTGVSAEKLQKTAENLWKKGFGENIGEVAKRVSGVSKALGDLSEVDLSYVTKGLDTFERMGWADQQEALRAINVLMERYGMTAQEATDFVTKGFQENLNYSGEFLDTISEYTTYFAEMGFTSDEMFAKLKSGAESGAFQLDKVGDAMKEFSVRAKDGSDTSADAFKGLGLNASEMTKQFNKGGDSAKKAFDKVVKALLNTKDETKQNEIAVGLFGTQFEDLGENAFNAMLTTSDGLKDVQGATEKASKALNDNFGARAKKVWREFQADMEPVGDTMLDIAEDILPKAADAIGELTDKFAKLSPEAKETAVKIAGITAVAGPVLMTVGSMANGIGLLTKGVGLATAAIGGSAGLTAAFSVLTGPIGLTVGGLALATGAVIAIKNSTEEARKVNLEHAESLVEQITSLDDLTIKYEGLRNQNKLTNDELLRFRDIQSELKTASSADEVARLKDEAAKLQEKSGLSNKELETMLSLNDRLIEKVPEAGQAFSDQGNNILTNTEDIKLANEALRENLQLELDIQRTKANAQLDSNIRDQIKAWGELEDKIKEVNDIKIEGAGLEYQLNQLKQEQQNLYSAGQDRIADSMNFEIRAIEQQITNNQKNVEAIAGEVEEKRKSVEQSNEQLAKTQEIYGELINLQLAQAGINAKGQEGIAQLDSAINKTQTRISELNKIDQAQGGLNEKQQTELDNLQEVIGKHRKAKEEIINIQAEQDEVKGKIDKSTKSAEELSDILGKSETKNIKFTGDGHSKAKQISDEAGRDVTKDVNVTDKGKAKKITDESKKGVNKGITFVAKNTVMSLLPPYVSVPIRFIGGAIDKIKGAFADGTRNAPGGLSLVGEEGRELLYSNKSGFALANGPSLLNLSEGTRVIPNADTEAILRNWNVPTKAANMAQKVIGGIQGFERYSSAPNLQFNFGGMMDGAVFHVREEADINKITTNVSRKIAQEAKREARSNGIIRR